jgi:outer membrane lipoprotein LolB
LTRSAVLKRVAAAILIFTLSACTTVPREPAGQTSLASFQARSGQLGGIGSWGLAGKISLDDGDQGGSGKLRWEVEPGFSELDFHGALGRGAWHLLVGPGLARLQLADGTEQTAPGVGELIRDQIGWPVPLDALQWWVRGLAAPGPVENRTLDAQGLLISLRQFGWSVEYNRYGVFAGLQMPERLDAKRDNYRVKLAISDWRLGADDAAAR